jgi:hypothetical protein
MSVRHAAIAALIAVAVPAQTPSPTVALGDASSPCVAVGVLYDHVDGNGVRLPADVAAVLAAVRLRRALAQAPAAQGSLHVDEACTCLVAAAKAGEQAQLQAFVASLATVPGSDDDVALAAAAAALAVDDERFLLPGGAHAAAARAALWPAALPAAGSSALAELTPAGLRALAQPKRRTVAGVLGPAAPGLVADAAAQQRVDLPPASGRGEVAAGGGDAMASELHPRVDQPFVALAFAVPAAVDHAALAVALAVARQRAAAAFPLRGSELRAGTPPVAWSWLRDDAFVVFHRRGMAPIAVRPGERCADAATERDATAAELRALLVALQKPIADAECAAGRDHAMAELGLRLRADAADPATAALCLRQALVRARHGIDPAALERVDAAAASAALQSLFAGPRQWHALMPELSPAQGFRPR